MKKLSSSLPNMVIVLTVTTLIAGFLLGYVNKITEGPRQAAEDTKRQAAIAAVISGYDNNPLADAREVVTADGQRVTIYPALRGGELVGAAVETGSANGFSGQIKVIVGFNAEGTVLGYEVTSHAETPGLGAKMTEWFKGEGSRGIAGRNPLTCPLQVSKDGGEVDAITAATISSRAFLEAINTGAEAMQTLLRESSNSNTKKLFKNER